MGALRTLACTLSLGFALLGAAPAAIAETDPLRMFAVCAGRLSALMEHQWLTDGPASEETARSRAAMLSLVEAILPPEAAPRALNWRIEAKAAQAALLARATFAADPVAARRADHLVAECLGLIGQS